MTIAEQLREEVEIEIAENMLDMGMDIEQIVEATKLSKKKIRELKRKGHH